MLKWIKFASTLTIELYILRCLCVQRSTTQIQNYHISFLTTVFTNFHPFPKPIQPSTFPYSMWRGKIFWQCGKIFDDVVKYSSIWHEIFSKYYPHSQALIFTHSCSHSHVHQIMLLLAYMPSYKLVFTYILAFEFVAYECTFSWALTCDQTPCKLPLKYWHHHQISFIHNKVCFWNRASVFS